MAYTTGSFLTSWAKRCSTSPTSRNISCGFSMAATRISMTMARSMPSPGFSPAIWIKAQFGRCHPSDGAKCGGDAAARHRDGMDAMSYQEKIVGNQMYFVFAMALLLVYLVLAGQYESWYAPLSVIFSVPLALAGPVLVLGILRIDNNLYTQIGIILL